MGENLWLRAKNKANLKPELKIKVARNACDKDLDGEMKSAYENYFKSSLENLQKSLPFPEIYIKYLEKNCTQVQFIVASISFHYRFLVRSKACDRHSSYL